MTNEHSFDKRVFVSWSGGKDSYLSLILALEQGLHIGCLLTFVSEDGHSRSHGVPAELLQQQAQALKLPIEVEKVTWKNYEAGFLRAVSRLKSQGIADGGVFGDVNLQEHREWIEKMCGRCGVTYELPLWGMQEKKVSEELLNRDGKAIIVSIRNDLLQEEWLGKEFDASFLDYCESEGLSPCGERGEFHTLVINGPYFQHDLRYRFTEIKKKGRNSYIE